MEPLSLMDPVQINPLVSAAVLLCRDLVLFKKLCKTVHLLPLFHRLLQDDRRNVGLRVVFEE